MDEELYVDSFKPHMMDVVNAWCNGAEFAQICKMTDIFEGKITFEFLIATKLGQKIHFNSKMSVQSKYSYKISII